MRIRRGNDRHPIRYGAAVAFCLFLLTSLNACLTTQADAPRDDFDRVSATRMFDAGFSYINDIYIEQPDLGALVMTGLNGLRRLEPGLAVVRSEDEKSRVMVMFEGRVAGSAVAGNGEAAIWAETAFNIVSAARGVSAPLRNATAEEIYEAVFNTISEQLDPYTRYTSADTAREERAQREGFGGIGVVVAAHSDGALIEAVKAGEPAAKTGLQKGDRILSIGPQSIGGLSIKRIVSRLRGPIGEHVEMLIRRDARSEPFTVHVVRERIVSQTIFSQIRDEIVHIRVTYFNKDTAHEMRRATEAARDRLGSQLRGLIIDVRGNPGGLLDQAVKLADLFLKSGEILRTRGRHPRSLQFFDADPEVIGSDIPIAVLLDGASASAAEIVASALQDQGRAIVIGASSFGKGTVQQVLRLPNNGELILTWARMHAPSGYILNKFGVLPNICTGHLAGGYVNLTHLTEKDGAKIRQDFSTRRAVDTSNAASAKKSCPWHPREERDVDLEIAERVLNKKDIYNKMLAYARPAAGS